MVHSSLDAVAGACVRDGEGHLWVEAGSLLRAHGGVCVLGEFSKFKKDLRQSVCRGEIMKLLSPVWLFYMISSIKCSIFLILAP